MADRNAVTTKSELKIVFSITDQKTKTYTLPDPSLALSYQDVKDWADLCVGCQAFVVDGLPISAFKEAYTVETTKTELEP